MRDKSALITGAAHGIGAEIARVFAQQGARLYLLDRDEQQLQSVVEQLRGAGATASALVADLRNPKELEQSVQRVHEEVQSLDVLVNNAGIYPRRAFFEMDEEEWMRILDVNLNGTYRCTRLVTPKMAERQAGKVINISSVTFHCGLKLLTHYVAAKGAVIGFTRALARELGEFNVHVNCVTPGAIFTETEAKFAGPDAAAEALKVQSLQRRILPVDIAGVCLFLATKWSDGMTGQTLNVDGGWIMH